MESPQPMPPRRPGSEPRDEPAGEIASRRVVDPARLPEAERRAFSARLYAIHARIFAGIGPEGFHDHVVAPSAERTRIQTYHDARGALAGYCAVHRYRRRVGGRAVLVIRAEAGLLPEVRGRGTTYWFGMLEAARAKLAHPFTPVWYLGTLVHTSSYHLFCKYFPRVYPGPRTGMPPPVRELAVELIEAFADPAVDPADPLIRDVGWITIETPQEAALNRRSELPDIRFFVARNPGYPQGHGLVVLVPITLANVGAALARRLAEVARTALRGRRPEL